MSVTVELGHPYEPMLAVSGMDHTIKIFSPDSREQYQARNGINLALDGFQRPVHGRYRLHRRRARAQAAAAAAAAAEDDDDDGGGNGRNEPADTSDDEPRASARRGTAAAAKASGGSTRDEADKHDADNDDDNNDNNDDDEADVADLPPTNGGLPSRRRMDQLYQITSQNEQRRQGGMHDARLTVGGIHVRDLPITYSPALYLNSVTLGEPHGPFPLDPPQSLFHEPPPFLLALPPFSRYLFSSFLEIPPFTLMSWIFFSPVCRSFATAFVSLWIQRSTQKRQIWGPTKRLMDLGREECWRR